MGSHLLVETVRNPECPKVSIKRLTHSSCLFLSSTDHWAFTQPRLLLYYSGSSHFCLSLTYRCMTSGRKKCTLKPDKTVWIKKYNNCICQQTQLNLREQTLHQIDLSEHCSRYYATEFDSSDWIWVCTVGDTVLGTRTAYWLHILFMALFKCWLLQLAYLVRL